MKVLVIGSGGREHAMAWKVAQDLKVSAVFVAPGNGGTATEAKCQNVDISVTDIPALLEFVVTQSIDLTIVGPEVPLVEGVVDQFQAQGFAILGPCQAAAQLEGSKAYSKKFFDKYNIPTAQYETFEDVEPALLYLQQQPFPIVIKADGLAAGKGVIIAADYPEAEAAVRGMLEDAAFGDAGQRVVIEDFLVGEEASYIVLCDGENYVPFASSQDHKAIFDGDKGPNTGGMGAYSPAPVVTAAIESKIQQNVIQAAIDGMKAEGHPFVGFLYAGIMVSPTGEIDVLEFNCRLGDPETQPLLFRLRSSLVDLSLAAIEGRLNQVNVDWDPKTALGVVVSAGGYPGAYDKGDLIDGLDDVVESKVFHAGTALKDGAVVTNGGRVLCVTALADDIAAAQKVVYPDVDKIRWNGAYYRGDIGDKALKVAEGT